MLRPGIYVKKWGHLWAKDKGILLGNQKFPRELVQHRATVIFLAYIFPGGLPKSYSSAIRKSGHAAKTCSLPADRGKKSLCARFHWLKHLTGKVAAMKGRIWFELCCKTRNWRKGAAALSRASPPPRRELNNIPLKAKRNFRVNRVHTCRSCVPMLQGCCWINNNTNNTKNKVFPVRDLDLRQKTSPRSPTCLNTCFYLWKGGASVAQRRGFRRACSLRHSKLTTFQICRGLCSRWDARRAPREELNLCWRKWCSLGDEVLGTGSQEKLVEVRKWCYFFKKDFYFYLFIKFIYF